MIADQESGKESWKRLLPRYLLAYSAWLILTALGLWAALQVRLATLAVFIPLISRGREYDTVTATGQIRTLDNIATIVLVLLWLGGIVLLESHLRDAVPIGRLRVRIGAVLAGELLLLIIAAIVQAVF